MCVCLGLRKNARARGRAVLVTVASNKEFEHDESHHVKFGWVRLQVDLRFLFVPGHIQVKKVGTLQPAHWSWHTQNGDESAFMSCVFAHHEKSLQTKINLLFNVRLSIYWFRNLFPAKKHENGRYKFIHPGLLKASDMWGSHYSPPPPLLLWFNPPCQLPTSVSYLIGVYKSCISQQLGQKVWKKLNREPGKEPPGWSRTSLDSCPLCCRSAGYNEVY